MPRACDVVIAGDARCRSKGKNVHKENVHMNRSSILKLYLAYAIMPLGEKTKVFKVWHKSSGAGTPEDFIPFGRGLKPLADYLTMSVHLHM